MEGMKNFCNEVIAKQDARIKELEKIISIQQETEKIFKAQNTQLLKVLQTMTEWHENQATWDKGNNG